MTSCAKIAELLEARVADARVDWRGLAAGAKNLSHAEITRAADEVLKEALIQGRDRVGQSDIHAMLEERQANRGASKEASARRLTERACDLDPEPRESSGSVASTLP